MTDNVTLPGTGAVVATDDDGTAQHQYVKLEWGPDNTQTKVDTASGKPLPVQLRSPTGVDLTGSAGTASAAVVTVQGIASGTTIPVTASAGTNLNTSALALETGGNLATIAGAVSSSKVATKAAAADFADGAIATLGLKADAKSTATDTTSVTVMQVLKQISASVQAPPSQAVTNGGTFAAQAAITAASGSIASGAVASGAVASGAFASGSIASGAMVDLGAIADAAVTAGATGSLSAKLRSISRDLVANIVLAAGTNLIGKVGIDQTTPGTTNAVSALVNGSVTNPTSTLTLTSATTAYGVGNLIASNATAGSVVVPSFAIANSAGSVKLSDLVLTSNDSTSTAWGAQTVQIDLWRTAPTFTNGDRAAYAIATGSANYIGSFTGVLSPVAGDGVYGRLTITSGNGAAIKLASGTSIFWTMQALTGSGVTGASKVFTLTAELTN